MALYHSAKGSVNYTVVGSPTIVDGVVSGCSGGDYLKLPQVNSPTQLEGIFCVNTGALSTSSYYICRAENHRLSVFVTNRRVRVFFQTEQEDYDTYLIGTTSLADHTKYWIKFSIKAGEQKLWVSTDGISYTLEAGLTKSTIYTGNLIFDIGVYSGGSSSSVWVGTIDLTETYIKVNGQPWFGLCPMEVKKHQLKGPVGYTVVGSPMIVDGVYSTSSASNYLRTETVSLPVDISKDRVEIVTKFALGETVDNSIGYILLNGLGSLSSGAAHQLRVAWGTTSSVVSGSIVLQPKTTYKAKVVCEDSTLSLYVAVGNGDYVLDGTATVEETEKTITRVQLGRNSSTVWLNEGNRIDLNETFVKVNGKLWFYQPADTKYIVKDGKLVWADPRIYLDNSSTTTRNYFSLQTLPENDTYKVYARVRPSSLKNNGIFVVNSTNRFTFVLGYNGPVYARIFGSSNTAAGVNYTPNDLIEMTASKDGFFGNVAGTSFNVAPAVTPTISSLGTEVRLLSDGPGTSFPNDFMGKLYATKVWSNGVLKEDIVPVPAGLKIGSFTVPSNGLFDMVKQQFYQNQGEETLLIGRDE